MAALDLFMYAACFEEFVMVVLEAGALGVPILTSRRVGASECLPAEYAPHLLDAPEPELFASKALELMANTQVRRTLIGAGRLAAERHGHEVYAARTVAAIQAQKPRLK
jgi:UDP-glucose:(heptosyl)LPS alpha-1,3-glucosyltransferase